jgi:PAS domain-containing protein
MPECCDDCLTKLSPLAAGRGGAACAGCAHFEGPPRAALSLGEYLDMFEHPVLVCDADGNVVAGNAALAALTGRPRGELAGGRAGEAVACERSRLPGGCGRTIHCRECTIRRMVAEVSRTRLARRRVPAYVEGANGRTELCITVRPREGALVEVILEDAPPPEETAGS